MTSLAAHAQFIGWACAVHDARLQLVLLAEQDPQMDCPSLLGEVKLSSLMEIAPTNCKFHQGFPRGQSGGPLFLLYINDLPDSLQSQVRLFADDTAAYLTVQGQDDNAMLQGDLDLLQKWEQEWDMEFNPSKCHVVHITRSRRPINTSYCMHGQLHDFVDRVLYLGVDIASDLNFNEHINRVSANDSKTFGHLKRNISTEHPGIREADYKTIVRPQLEYASTVWNTYTKKIMTKLKWFKEEQ